MATDTQLPSYLGIGLHSARPASGNPGPGMFEMYYETDTTTLFLWNGAAWVAVTASTVLTTKGDLYGFSTVPARVPVGSNGLVLTADSTAATGVSWQSGGGGGSDPISSIYPVFTPTGSDDEFSAGSFSGWTATNSGSHAPTLTQVNNTLSMAIPGSDSLGEMHAWSKAPTITAGSYVQAAWRSFGLNQNFNSVGIFFADGTTYGSGNQFLFYESSSEGFMRSESHTNYSSQGTSNTDTIMTLASRTDIHCRITYNGSNSFTTSVSPDGVSFATVRTMSFTMTPTVAGFWVSTQGGTKPMAASFRYCRFG